jgi:predicted nucleic acid-binding protein
VLLVDTNLWLIAADRRSDRHDEIVTLLEGQDWASPTPVITETAWMILDRLGPVPQARFLRLVTTGQLDPVELTLPDWQRCLELCERYADLRLDLADASLVAVAERFGLTTIATLNRRDFTVVRPAHAEAFELVP